VVFLIFSILLCNPGDYFSVHHVQETINRLSKAV
jgi:hypothetical protein